MIGDGRLEPDALILPVADAATLWDLSADAARRAYTALERDGLLARCPDCRQWVVMPMASRPDRTLALARPTISKAWLGSAAR